MRAYERLLHYVSFGTQSDHTSETVPSTPNQKVLAAALVEEMKKIGIADAFVDDKGYVYGTIPATKGKEDKPVIGFIAHMDTAEDASGDNIKAKVVEYNGGDVLLNEEKQIFLSEKEYPDLKKYVGQHLMVTDGTTLLGADDKAGVAEILSAAEKLLTSDRPHGTVKIAFTPDEEIGEGADRFDVTGFGADYAYTVDGGAIGELEYENFNAASASVENSAARAKLCHAGIDGGESVDALFIEHFPEAHHEVAAGDGVVGCPVMVEFRKTQSIGYNVELVFAQVRHQVLCQNERVDIGRLERKLEALACGSDEADVKIGVVRAERSAADKVQKFRQHLFDGRRTFQHLVGDAGQLDDLGKQASSGGNKGLEGIDHLVALHDGRADFDDRVVLRR